MQGKEGIVFCFLSSLAWVKVLKKKKKDGEAKLKLGFYCGNLKCLTPNVERDFEIIIKEWI
jgi:hypothetical protein